MTETRSIQPNRVIQAFGGNEPSTFHTTAEHLRQYPLEITMGDRTVAGFVVEDIYRCAHTPGRREEARKTLSLTTSRPVSDADLDDFLLMVDDLVANRPAAELHQSTTVTLDASALETLRDGRSSYGLTGSQPMQAAFAPTTPGVGFRQPRMPDPGSSQRALLQAFQRGDFVYSRNFGILDRDHIAHNAEAYRSAYDAAMRSLATTPPSASTVRFVYGSGTTRFPTEYTITAQRRPGESAADCAHRIAREIVVNASVRYEEHTNIGINPLIPGAVGTSAFSTEDLPSNALGMEAAAAYVRGEGVRPGESLEDYSLRFVTMRAGTLYPYSEDSADRRPGVARLERHAHGNFTFRPVYSPDVPGREPSSTLYGFLEACEGVRHLQARTDVTQPDATRGWHLSDSGPSLPTGVLRRVGGLFGG